MNENIRTLLTELRDYGEAQRHFSKEKLWELFDGDRDCFNIAHEGLHRHPPDRVAVRIAHGDGSRAEHSFGELAAWSSRFAAWLRARGVSPGERVAVMLEPSLAFYFALFGAMEAGAVAVPLFTLFGPEGLRLRLADCDPALVLVAPDKAHLAREAMALLVAANDSRHSAREPVERRVVVANDDFLAQVGATPRGSGSQGEVVTSAGDTPAGDTSAGDTAARDIAMFQYTSGTTRELPEAVRHRHRALVTVMIAALYGTGIRPGDLFMCPSSPAWGHGLWHGTLAPLAMGVTVAAYGGRFDPVRLLEALHDFRITNLSAAATHYRMMMNCGQAHRFRFAIEKLSFTGEPMDSTTERWVRDTFGTPACSIYGTTEVGVVLAQYPGARDFKVIPGALGKPVPGVELAVLDERGRPCPPGTVGHLTLKRREGWFPTKDRAHVDGEGHYFYNGRADDVIISAGWTMSAVEIEDVLLMHPAVAEAAVIPVPDAERGQVAKAFLVLKPGHEPTPEGSPTPRDSPPNSAAPDTAVPETVRDLQSFVQERLSRHEYPRQIAFVTALPKTQAGKVNRRILREREQQSAPESHIPPSTRESP